MNNDIVTFNVNKLAYNRNCNWYCNLQIFSIPWIHDIQASLFVQSQAKLALRNCFSLEWILQEDIVKFIYGNTYVQNELHPVTYFCTTPAQFTQLKHHNSKSQNWPLVNVFTVSQFLWANHHFYFPKPALRLLVLRRMFW